MDWLVASNQFISEVCQAMVLSRYLQKNERYGTRYGIANILGLQSNDSHIINLTCNSRGME